jgi:hypothetical protein
MYDEPPPSMSRRGFVAYGAGRGGAGRGGGGGGGGGRGYPSSALRIAALKFE